MPIRRLNRCMQTSCNRFNQNSKIMEKAVRLRKEVAHMTPLQIAIDGEVGAGKSDISSRLAHELGLTYFYTGAMYRALALACTREGVAFTDKEKVIPLLDKYTIDLRPPAKNSKRGFSVVLNEEDITDQLFTPLIDKGSSSVSTVPDVRKFMVRRQQELAQGKSVVMEGRDIGLRVLPNAQLKIYLTASVEERVRRRWEQNQKQGIHQTREQVLADTRERDEQDKTRQTDPLTKVPDAWELDTTGMSREQVVAAIVQELQNRKLI